MWLLTNELVLKKKKNFATLKTAHRKYRVTQKKGILKNPTKIEEIQEKNLLTEIEPLQLAFYETVIQIINV